MYGYANGLMERSIHPSGDAYLSSMGMYTLGRLMKRGRSMGKMQSTRSQMVQLFEDPSSMVNTIEVC